MCFGWTRGPELRLEIRNLVRGREQASLRRPELSILIAITFMKDFGVRDGENLSDIFTRQIVHGDVEIGRQGNRPKRHQLSPGMKNPAKERIRRQPIDLARHAIAD